MRGIVEDALGKTRRVRVSVPAFAYVADLVDGSALLATVPLFLARHVQKTRPHLEALALPFSFGGDTRMDLLWPRAKDQDPLLAFVRGALERSSKRTSPRS